MTIEVIINGRLTAIKEVSEIKLRGIPYLSFKQRYIARENIINSYLDEIKRQLKPVLRFYSSYQLEYRLTFQSKMNRKGFIVERPKKRFVKDYQLKTA
jgi:hypothetical protein